MLFLHKRDIRRGCLHFQKHFLFDEKCETHLYIHKLHMLDTYIANIHFHTPPCSICGESYFCHWCAGYPADIHRIINGGHGGHVVFGGGILDAQRMGMLSQLVRMAPDAVLRLVSGLSCRTASQKPVAVIGGLPPNYRKQFRIGCLPGENGVLFQCDSASEEFGERHGNQASAIPQTGAMGRLLEKRLDGQTSS